MTEGVEAQISDLLRDPTCTRKAFELIVKCFSEPLYWQIRRMVVSHDDANDILQNALIKVWTNLAGFRGEAKMSTWLYRIVTNETITFLQLQRQQQGISLDDVDVSSMASLESPSEFSGDEAQRKLQKAILTLPDKQRLVFTMKYYQEMKYEEMSAVLGTSVGALKASYHFAVKKIEQILVEEI